MSPNSKQFSQSKNIKQNTKGFICYSISIRTGLNFFISMVFDIDVTSDTVFAQYQMWQQSINTTLGMSAQYPIGFILL
ncbi:MAG TPA: hypothetical protein VER14_04780 [Phototrophicaceae bacterium]|nr:hypothetical protein [Phototrophicaceae bacterium]